LKRKNKRITKKLLKKLKNYNLRLKKKKRKLQRKQLSKHNRSLLLH